MAYHPKFVRVFSDLMEPELKLRISQGLRDLENYSMQYIDIFYDPEIAPDHLTMPCPESLRKSWMRFNEAPPPEEVVFESGQCRKITSIRTEIKSVGDHLRISIPYGQHGFRFDAEIIGNSINEKGKLKQINIIKSIIRNVIKMPFWDAVAESESTNVRYVDGSPVRITPHGVKKISLYIEKKYEKDFPINDLFKISNNNEYEALIETREVRS